MTCLPPQSAPFHPPLFGASLEEVMELQTETHPELPIPWVVTALCDVVLTLNGPKTEGIFRYIHCIIEGLRGKVGYIPKLSLVISN